MTRPKRPTLAELRKEARRVFGRCACAEFMRESTLVWRSDDGDVAEELFTKGDGHRARMLTMLRALPDWRKP